MISANESREYRAFVKQVHGSGKIDMRGALKKVWPRGLVAKVETELDIDLRADGASLSAEHWIDLFRFNRGTPRGGTHLQRDK